MKVSLCQSVCSSIPSSCPRQHQILPHRLDSTTIPVPVTRRARPWLSKRGGADRRGWEMAVECANLGAGPVARELEDEAAEWMKVGRLREKCGEGGEMMEILECLEREAIMGEDQGRDPNDYNRRAQIFDRSARVFQALKDRPSTTSTTTNRHES